MPYRLTIDESVASGIRRICAEQIDRAVGEIDDVEVSRSVTVHQVRKRCKKVRGALRLVRGELDRDETYRTENAWFRDSARILSRARDSEVLVETFEGLVEEFTGKLDRSEIAPLRQHLVSERQEAMGQSSTLNERLEQVRARLLMARDRIAAWPFASRGFDALRPGLEKTYRRCRKAFSRACDCQQDEAFHHWRKRVKYHWYHCRLLHDIWPPVMAARSSEADRLADLLGREHDLTVLRRYLSEEAEPATDWVAPETLTELTTLHSMTLRQQAELLGQRLLVEGPRRFGQRLEAYWLAWRGGALSSTKEAH